VSAAERLTAVRSRIDAAAIAAGRDPATVHLVAVSKYHSAADVRGLVAAGQTVFGESREQDLRAKRELLADLPELAWHFIGRLQSNKARAVGRLADLVHSLDRAALVAPLARGAAERDTPLPVLLQISLDGDPARGGADPAQLSELAALIGLTPALALAGVMAVAAPTSPPGPQFSRLAQIAADLRAEHPAATTISAGMSGDLEEAVAAGATLVRVGTALFGERPDDAGPTS
jgi:pyridoxal phosphate enzyme (YggS family)